MNQVYRVIFNRSLGVWQCVSEMAKAKSKSKSVKALAVATAMVMAGQASAVNVNGDNQFKLNENPLFIGSTNRIIADGQNRVLESLRQHESEAQYHLWVRGIGAKSNLAHDGLRMGYQNTDKGIVIGSDKHLTDRLSAGMALSYVQSEADSLDHVVKHKMTAETTGVLAFADYHANEAIRAHAYVGAGRANIGGERMFSAALSNSSSMSDYSAKTYQAGVAVHHRLGTERRHISPYIALVYQQVAANGYNETGAGVLNLSVADQTYKSVRTTVGVQAAKNIGGNLTLQGNLAAALENGDQSTDIRASLAGAPNDSFYTLGRSVGREALIAGTGLSYAITPTTSVAAGYLGEWRKDYDNQAVHLGMTMKF